MDDIEALVKHIGRMGPFECNEPECLACANNLADAKLEVRQFLEKREEAMRELAEELTPSGDIAKGLNCCYIHSDTIKRARAALDAAKEGK